MADLAIPPAVASLAQRVRAGEPRAIARAISLIEDDQPGAAALVGELFRATGGAYLVGVTGPPGAGKSTLVDRLSLQLRARDETVGIIAVDPTSPYSGGAILGDRSACRRRPATTACSSGAWPRGATWRPSRATHDAAYVLDAAGKHWVVIETVGVGQDEVDIVRTADIAIVVLVPGTETRCRRSRPASWRSPTSSWSTSRTGKAPIASRRRSRRCWRCRREPGAWRRPSCARRRRRGRACRTCWPPSRRSGRRTGTHQRHRRRARHAFRLRELLADRFMEHVDCHVLAPGPLDGLLAQIQGPRPRPLYGAEQAFSNRSWRDRTA